MKAANPREPLSGVCALMPAKILKDTFLLSYFSVKKSTKSQQGGLTPSSFRTTGAACTNLSHEPCVASACGKGQSKNRRFCRSPQSHTTTRANISHEIAEQIRARIVCTPAESARRELTHMRSVAVRLSSACGKGQDFINPHQAFLIGYQDFLFFQYFFDRPFRLFFRRAFLYEKCT